MSSPAIILTSEFVISHDEGSINYLDRRDRQIDSDKEISIGIEGEAHEIMSLDMIRQLDESDFSNYLNYLGRQQALEKNNSRSEGEELELVTIEKKLKNMEQNSKPPTNHDNHMEVRGLFDKENDTLTPERKEFYKEFFSAASNNGAFLFQDVVSFDTKFLVEQGVFVPLTKQLDSTKLKQAGRLMMKKYFELENLEETGQWVGAIHYNTEHFHIHFSTTESKNTRDIITITDKQTGQKKDVRNGFKKQNTINQMKAIFANQLIDRSQELEKISRLRNHLVLYVRESNHESKLKKQLNELKKILPIEKKKWQYNRLSSSVKLIINETVESLLKENKDFNQFKQLIKEEGRFRNSLYRKESKNEYYQNKMKDMNVRFGNALLKNMKEVEKEIAQLKRMPMSYRLEVKNESKPIKKIDSNLKNYSKLNQEKIRTQLSSASFVKTEASWKKEGREPTKEAVPIEISIPIMSEDGKELKGFDVGYVYDVSQTEVNRRFSFQVNMNSHGNYQPNLDKYSTYNQEKLKKQLPNVSVVGTSNYWRKEGRTLIPGTKPLEISIPIMTEDGKKLLDYDVGYIYDISQTVVVETKEKTLSFSDEKKKLTSNLTSYSKFNQQKLKEQMPEVTTVGSRYFWKKEGRFIAPDSEPLYISIPVMKEDGKTLSHFSEGVVYDISQTKLFSNEIQNAPVNKMQHSTDLSKQFSNNMYRYTSKQRESIQEQSPGASTVMSRPQWLEKGLCPRHLEQPIFIESTFKNPETQQIITYERAVYDVSQVRQATKYELKQLQKEYDSLKQTRYQPSAIEYSNHAVRKLSNLLEKDYDTERNKFEKERLDRQVHIAQQEASHGY
ncbi:MobP2 family relaxase [Vagococcus fluvialis]|uniref:Uncharacterized protein n=1 Tax=Vagococcus fluvialis TaxID=2738 RepID=A0A7X6DB29_9ENTE|nr:MobP2 family relaxase [Vagococcus fluvialis]NKC69079.1 hypothetical protein [Vagococcus fluvialis]